MTDKKQKKSMNCPICIERYNSGTHHPIVCPKQSCQYSACEECICTYLLGQKSTDPKCMMCKTVWTFEFLSKVTPESFHNKKYRSYRTTIVREREGSLMAATQQLVVEEIKRRKKLETIKRLKSECKMYKKIIEENNENILQIRFRLVDKKSVEKLNIKRPRTAYTIFSKLNREKVKKKTIKNRRRNNISVTILLRNMWDNLSQEKQEKYHIKAAGDIYKFRVR